MKNPPPRKKTKSYNDDGEFYAGYVSAVAASTRSSRRRVLCFATHAGFVGASVNFEREEAYRAATQAERGLLPVPSGSNQALLITRLLKQRGFPVKTPNDYVDDRTAEFILREFAARRLTCNSRT